MLFLVSSTEEEKAKEVYIRIFKPCFGSAGEYLRCTIKKDRDKCPLEKKCHTEAVRRIVKKRGKTFVDKYLPKFKKGRF